MRGAVGGEAARATEQEAQGRACVVGLLGASIHPDPGEPSEHQKAHDVEGALRREEEELKALALADPADHAANLDALVHDCAWAEPLAVWPDHSGPAALEVLPPSFY